MADFHQNGVISTLHNLTQRPVEELEADLCQFAKTSPMALALPSLYSELRTPALSRIVDELCQVPYLAQVVIGLDEASEADYRHALRFFSRLPQKAKVLWNDGPRLRKIDAKLREKNLAPTQEGKGRNVWHLFGYLLASKKAQAVALHDCDITTYERGLLARLLYPLAHPDFHYKFAKGYYARVADGAMNGRVCRLLVTPLLHALQELCGSLDFLKYLDSFRYVLAGECALTREIIEDLHLPSNWGLEIGILSEMHRNHAPHEICQVDIAELYDHKHQDLSAEDDSKGLSKMSIDICLTLFRELAAKRQIFSPELIADIQKNYQRFALNLLESYRHDAQLNGLNYDRTSENAAVALFAKNIVKAGDHFLNPTPSTSAPFMPNWKKVIAIFPDILNEISQAVDDDMAEFGTSFPE